MSIVIFEDVTTESALLEIESNAKKYEGLYVEMGNAPERKYVKGMASDINAMLKKLDRARIDKSKEYKQKVESEALIIKSRLEKANEPFTLLIDEYTAKRAEILAKEKAARDAIELRKQVAQDHEFALLLDDKFESEKLQREQDKFEYEEKLKAEAVENARLHIQREAEKNAEDARIEIECKAEAERQEALKGEADTEHRKAINNAAVDGLLKLGLDQAQCKAVVTAIAKGEIENVRINY